MFNLNQNHTNFLIEPNPANGLEWQMMSYTLNNNTVLQVNITYTNVLVPGSINTLLETRISRLQSAVTKVSHVGCTSHQTSTLFVSNGLRPTPSPTMAQKVSPLAR